MKRGRLLWEITRWELLRWLKIKDLVLTMVISTALGLAIWGGLALFEKVHRDAVKIAVLNPEALPFELPSGSVLEIGGSSWSDEDEAFRALEGREIDAVLRLDGADAAELVVTREPVWKGELENALSTARRQRKLEASGLDAGAGWRTSSLPSR